VRETGNKKGTRKKEDKAKRNKANTKKKEEAWKRK
jgi:hypothetical protein